MHFFRKSGQVFNATEEIRVLDDDQRSIRINQFGQILDGSEGG